MNDSRPRKPIETETATGRTPPDDTPGESARFPSSIGGYRIYGKLGEGGMGVVYEAQQRNPNRRVALKVVRGGAFVDESRARMFQREADSLARLKHPNIGAIYESGRTEDGQHFFAMELVRGGTLDVYLKKRPETIESGELRHRLELFRTIADAVQYAHQRGVIHRDLKPSNIIVREEGRLPEIKILDFGLARITDTDVAATSVLSSVGVIKGTLTYMSPEQARGDPAEIDVRADVYALGVILYEVLVGSRPHDVQGKSLAEAVRVICEEPPRPLRQAWTAARKPDPDIETIVGTALDKEADRRYASAAALSDDVQRYLDSQPILARPPSTIYQLRKFARRHRTLVGATSVILVVLVVSLVVTLQLYLRSETERVQKEREAARATAVVDFILKDMIGAANPEHGGHEVRVIDVLESAAESAEARFADEPRLEGEVRNVLGRTYHSLGLYPESIEQFELAESILSRTVGGDDIETIRALRRIGVGSRSTGDFERAENAGREALTRARRALGPDNTLTVLIGADLGELLQSLGRHEEAEPILRETLTLLERTEGRDNRHTVQVLVSLAASLYAQRRRDEALVLQRDAVDRSVRAFGASHPFTIAAMNNLANTLMALERFDEAVEVAMRLDETIDEVFPPEHPAHAFVALTCASGLQELGRLNEASRYGQTAYDMFLATLGADRWETERSAYLNWGLARALNDANATEQWGLRTLQTRLRVAGPGELESVTGHIERMESDLIDLGRTDAAAGLISHLAAGAEDSVPSPHPRRARYLGNLGRAVVALDRDEDAKSLLLAANDALSYSEAAEEDRTTVGAALHDLYEARDNKGEAERWQLESGS